MNRFLCSILSCTYALCCCTTTICFAQELSPSPILNFARDVQPILETRCLHCHGAEEAKNDFRVDDIETMMSYLEPGDVEGSSLWTDYLVTEDADMLMPPATATTPAGLPGNELAVIKLWIEEDAGWGWESDEAPVEQTIEKPLSMPAKVWAFQGLFHPASVHFPVALLMVSGLFSFLAIFRRGSFEYVAFHCLWIGALGAVGSSIMGWSYAVHEGYGDGFSWNIQESAIDRHRWLGIGTAIGAILLIPLAKSAVTTGAINKRILWCAGSAVIAIAISIVGYQGGELTFGEDHYAKEFDRLFSNDQVETSGDQVESKSVAPAESTDDFSELSETTTD